jgi:hypothetical protein
MRPITLYFNQSTYKFFRLMGQPTGRNCIMHTQQRHQTAGWKQLPIEQSHRLQTERTGRQPDLDKLAKAILLFRNARRYGGASPVVFNRPIRDNLPAHQRSFAPEWQRAAEVLEQRMHRALALTTNRYNASPYHLAAFPLGTHVLVQHQATK